MPAQSTEKVDQTEQNLEMNAELDLQHGEQLRKQQTGPVNQMNKIFKVKPNQKNSVSDKEPEDERIVEDGVQLSVNTGDDSFLDESSSGSTSSDSESTSDESSDESSEEDERWKRKQSRAKRTKKIKKWKNDPDFMQLIDEIVDRKSKKKRKSKGKPELVHKGRVNQFKTKKPQISPSMDTIYVPTLRKIVNKGTITPTNAITQGLKQIRLANSMVAPPASKESDSDEAPEKRAKPSQAEAAISAPQKGMAPGRYFNDDMDIEFMHVACRVDEATKSKIEKGQYVDLEKLLPKKKALKFTKEDDQRMQMVNRNGFTCWVPEEKLVKIDNLKKWEEAFDEVCECFK